MGVVLKKGQKVSLSKSKPGLNHISIGLGWDISNNSSSYDLDAQAFLLGDNGKVICEEDFVFYNNLSDMSGGVVHQGDNLTGEGDGDDEVIDIDLGKVPMEIKKIAFTVTIHDAEAKGQSFGQVDNSYIRVVDTDNADEIFYFDLAKECSTETAIIAGEIYRHNDEWKFHANGSGYNGGLEALCINFGIDVEGDSQPAQEEEIKEPTKIDLLKKKVGVVLEKKNISDVVAKVGLVLDISGSMFQLYKKGIVQGIVERILAVASRFDDDGQLDMWMFDHRFHRLPVATEGNFENYINREIIETFPRKQIFGRNQEKPVIEDVIKKYIKEEPSNVPVFIVFISDGGVRNSREMEKLITSASDKPIFWQFVGIGKSNYGVFEKLDNLTGRVVDNADFFCIDNIKKITDEELYNLLLNEFPGWIHEAKRLNII